MEKYFALLNEIGERGLKPDPRFAGRFIAGQNDGDSLKFLSPNNWVFHNQIVECVLNGQYSRIKPVCAEFVPTLNCSNRCGICAYQLPKKLEGCWERNLVSDPDCQMQDAGVAKEMLQRLFDYGVKGIIFTGGGEPFLFPWLEDLVQYSTDRGVDSVVYTNGNIVSPERARKAVRAGPKLIRQSLNAGREEVYDRFHNSFAKGAFGRAIRTLEEFAQEAKNNPETSIGVGIVVNAINQHDLVEAALRLREISEAGGRIDFVTYRPEFNYYGADQLPKWLLERTFEIVETDVKKVLDGTGIFVNNVSSRYEALKKDDRTYDLCRASGMCAEIAPSGAYFCCDRNLNRKYLIGNLENQKMGQINFGEQRARVQAYVDEQMCRVCPPACKSHEINKQFQQIEDLRNAGEIYKARVWIDEQRKLPKPKMVNFP